MALWGATDTHRLGGSHSRARGKRNKLFLIYTAPTGTHVVKITAHTRHVGALLGIHHQSIEYFKVGLLHLNDVVYCAKLAGHYWLGKDRQAEITTWKVSRGVFSGSSRPGWKVSSPGWPTCSSQSRMPVG